VTQGLRPFLALVALAFAVHGHTLAFGFAWFDDDKLVVMDQAFLRDPANLPRAFQRDVFGTQSPTYRPLLTVSFMVDAWMGGRSPFVYHLTNVIVHAIATVGVFLVLVTHAYPRGPGLLAAAVFGVHPVLASGVAWIPGRNDGLLTVFALFAWLAFVRYARSESWAAYAAHVVLFAAAVFTKETAIALPLVATVYLGLLAPDALRPRRTGFLIGGWLAVVFLWLALRAPVLAEAPRRRVTLDDLAFNARAVLELLGDLVAPFPLPVYPTVSRLGTSLGVAVALLLLAAIVLLPRDRRRHGLFGVAWFVLLYAPTLGVHRSIAGFDYLHHRLYLPLVGLAMLALEVALAWRAGRRVALAVAACGVLLAGLAVVHARKFQDDLTFWRTVVRTVPEEPEAWHSLGYVLQRRGDMEGAESAYRRAIELSPRTVVSAKYHLNLGMVYELTGRLPAAAGKYADAIALKPDYAAAHANLGGLHYGAGRMQEAEAEYVLAMASDPRFPPPYVSMCGLRLRQNRLEEAERFCHTALGLDPNAQRAILALAVIYYIQGKYPESIRRVDDLRRRGAPVDRLIPDIVAGLEKHRTK
jgi:Flp pilus assembly protein TadD